MKGIKSIVTCSAMSLSAAIALASAVLAQGDDRVAFPDRYKDGVHYATVGRGNIREELYVSKAAAEAARRTGALPDGTVITMEDFRSGALYRYVVMEKRAGWGARYAEAERNGDWEFQSFKPDRSVNRAENVSRCMGCHKSQAGNDFVFTLDRIKATSHGDAAASLKNLVGAAHPAHHDRRDLDVDASTLAFLSGIAYGIRTTILSPGAVATELTTTITDPDVAVGMAKTYANAISPDAFARAVVFAMSQPADVDINEILFRPTSQAY